MCIRCRCFGFRVTARVGHRCASVDERDRCKRCGQMRNFVVVLDDRRGIVSALLPCRCEVNA